MAGTSEGEKKAQELGLERVETTENLPFVETLFRIESCSSTNVLIDELAHANYGEGTVVIAEEQTGGYGRQKSSWFSHAETIEMSMLLRPPKQGVDLPFINVLFSYAALKATYETCKLPALLKWPNDILVRGRKLSGVMSELKTDDNGEIYIVLGFGLNVNVPTHDFPEPLRSVATSLLIEGQEAIDKDLLLERVFRHFSVLYPKFLQAFH